MNYETFKSGINENPAPDPSMIPALQALWWDARGDWTKAHEVCQNAGSSDGDWVHAYLHRKEGDESNASYWYGRAGKPKPSTSLEEEWEALVKHFLNEKK